MCPLRVHVVRRLVRGFRKHDGDSSPERSFDATFASDSIWATRIPTAVVVMSIGAVVLHTIMIHEWSNVESRRDRQRQEQAEVKARFEAETARADREGPPIEMLYGQTVATMGAAFDSVTLGADAAGSGRKCQSDRRTHPSDHPRI